MIKRIFNTTLMAVAVVVSANACSQQKNAVTAMNIYEIADGKIVREHGLPDLFNMMLQLGVLPPPAN